MEIAAGMFEGEVTSNGFMPNWSYRIDAHGIKQRAQPHPWAEVALVEAWLTTADGNWGDDDTRHLRLTFRYGYRLHLTEWSSMFTDLVKALACYLGVVVDWRGGEVAAEYQRRCRRWHRGWLGGRHKPVVYQRAE